MFKQKIIERHTKNIDEAKLKTAYENMRAYQAKVQEIKNLKEEQYQDGFLRDVFVDCLGYTMQPDCDYNLSRERKNEIDSKKADGAITIDSDVIALIELKDQNTKNLDAARKGELSPVDQCFRYLNSHQKAKYAIVSNFDELRLYVGKKTEYEKFNLFSLDFEGFKRFYLVLSFESVKNGLPQKLKEETDSFEKQISKELYRDYSLFRSRLFEDICANNSHTEPQKLLRHTQTLCDRIIFILFAEDRELLGKNTIKEIRERYHSDIVGLSMYDYYKIYFKAINEGNPKLGILGYNGGLFARNAELDSLFISDKSLDMQAQKLSDYDFESDISVNILGHIFEQSLTDLEELLASLNGKTIDKSKSKRKKDGVFYTPEYITRYIVANTLGRLCEEKKASLDIIAAQRPQNTKKLTKIEEAQKSALQEYKEWLKSLRICDPACGSGAFLNQALEYLISEHKATAQQIVYFGDLTATEDIEKSILEHNLYGVDINEEAVEIARLSLWLRTAQRGRKLTNLSDKIKVGNSLISDGSVDDRAFDWQAEFPDVFARGGFDVIIGNPPYGAQLSEEHKKYFYANFKTVEYQIDTYTLFMEMLSLLTAPKGKAGYIVPSTWLAQNYFKNIRRFLIENFAFDNLILFKYDVFENVTAETSIFIAECSIPSDKQEIAYCVLDEVKDFEHLEFQKINRLEWAQNYDKGFNLTFDSNQTAIIRKMEEGGVKLEDIADIVSGMVPYESGKGTPKQTIEDVKNRIYDADYKMDESYLQYIVGGNIQKFTVTPDATKWIKFGSNLAAPRNFDYSQNKIVVRQTSDIIICAVDYEGFLNLKSIHNIVLKSQESISHEALAVILNSSLMDVYYTYLVPEKGRVFAEVKGVNLRKLPIKIPTSEQNQILTELYHQMLVLKKRLNTQNTEFKSYLNTVLNVIKIPSKLDTPQNMSFDELKTVLEKSKVDMKDISVFRSVKQLYDEMLYLGKEIIELNRQIDLAVVRLYGVDVKFHHVVPFLLKQ